MAAELHVQTEVPPISWDEFRSTYPAGSIALDGFVADRPLYDPTGPYLNANHHENVNRLATLSTAQQIARSFRMGMTKAFTKDGLFTAEVYVNDNDQDVCAAWYLLDNPSQAKAPSPALNRFLDVAGALDVTAGAFPYDPDMKILQELAWVFEPYTLFRSSGEMAKKNNGQYRSVIDDIQGRIGKHLNGRGQSTKLDTNYEVIASKPEWTMIREIGKDGRVGALMDGVDAYISVQDLSNERWRYSVGRRSEFIPFPLPILFDALNNAEQNSDDKWGGATTIGGSPRVGASKLHPKTVVEIVSNIMERAASELDK